MIFSVDHEMSENELPKETDIFYLSKQVYRFVKIQGALFKKLNKIQCSSRFYTKYLNSMQVRERERERRAPAKNTYDTICSSNSI